MSTCCSLTAPIPPVSTFLSRRMNRIQALCAVPMEEVVRAFNWVIQQGWVRIHMCLIPSSHLCSPRA